MEPLCDTITIRPSTILWKTIIIIDEKTKLKCFESSQAIFNARR